jgi:hypothetical protein
LDDGYGTDVAARAREVQTPIVWMSGDADSITSILGGTILRKPFFAEDLLETVALAMEWPAS